MPRANGLTVGSLRALIKDVRDDTVVLVPAPDHSYERATASLREVAHEGTNRYAEVDPAGGPVSVTALVIS